jgi:hypothetical protein
MRPGQKCCYVSAVVTLASLSSIFGLQAEQLLHHEKNGDGAYLVRYSRMKNAFALSIKYMNSSQNDWAITHNYVMRTDQENNKVFRKKHANFNVQA